MTKAIRITADKQVTEIDLPDDVDPLGAMQGAVGGLVEPVALDPDLAIGGLLGTGGTMWVNEEGKINDLPFNSIATDVALPWLYGDTIVGDVFVVGPQDRDGRDTDVTEWLRRRIRLVASEAGAQEVTR